MRKEALFSCDACFEEAKDSSYVCTICEFWIHKTCAFSPFVIPSPTYHHHPLKLVYSIPYIHRYFDRLCGICGLEVQTNHWLYYCHKCTYFVHMRCATSTKSMINEFEADVVDDKPDFVLFPLRTEESIFDLIIVQCGKIQVNFQGEATNSITKSMKPDYPHMMEEHWSHKNHPLELQISIGNTDNGDSNDAGRDLICDGCIQPITVSHPSYYTCIQCGFHLHSFCATKLPRELPVGSSSFHPEHTLFLQKRHTFNFVTCGVCSFSTNGFYYHCERCDVKIDIRCAFLPTRIIHRSHKHHFLVQRPISNSLCSVSKLWIEDSMGYKCETCSSFQIHILCAIYVQSMKHRYDVHPVTSRDPPFFYEGVFYCEICEEQVNNQWWLYRCGGCDQSFHFDCLRWHESVKLGGMVQLSINNQQHTLTLVLKRPTRKDSPLYICQHCCYHYSSNFFLECDGCGFLICIECAPKFTDEYRFQKSGLIITSDEPKTDDGENSIT